METLLLREPSREDKGQIVAFVESLRKHGQDLDGFAFIEVFETYEEWLEFIRLMHQGRVKNRQFVPSTTMVMERVVDGKVVGIVDIRHRLNEFLETKGGHIGYSVIPNEQGRGYGREILRLALDYAKKVVEGDRLLLVCEEENLASKRIMEGVGGTYIKTREVEGVPFLYYEIKLSREENDR